MEKKKPPSNYQPQNDLIFEFWKLILNVFSIFSIYRQTYEFCIANLLHYKIVILQENLNDIKFQLSDVDHKRLNLSLEHISKKTSMPPTPKSLG